MAKDKQSKQSNKSDANITTKENNEIDKAGRPCKYESHVQPYLDKVYDWLIQGYTEYSIAEQLGIHRYTLIKYKEQYNDLIDTFTRAREERNKLVMNRMYSKACGEIAQVKQQKMTKDGQIISLTSEIYTPPDVNAADLYLRNNDPEYKTAKTAETQSITINNYSLEDLKAKRQEILDKIRKAEAIEVDYKEIK